MPSNHLTLYRPLLLLPSSFPSIRVFSNESALHMRWPKYWSFSFNISPSSEHPGLISFRMDWLDLLESKGLSRVFSNTPYPCCFFECSVTQSCPAPCNPMDCGLTGSSVNGTFQARILEWVATTQTYVHRVSDAIQPSHPLSSPSPAAFNLSQHQGLFP